MDKTHSQEIARFWLIGINYKKTNTATRGAFSISPEQYDSLLAKASDYGVSEFFVLSTCNRTEIYGCADTSEQLANLLCSETPGTAAEFLDMAYLLQGYAAAGHLFRVAAGLDSQILGDFEILGQIKKAVKQSKLAGHIGQFTERLLNVVMQSSKAVKTNTALSSGTVSVSFAVVQYIKEHRPVADELKIALIGAGKIGSNTCRNLVDYLGTHNITLLNRTAETAMNLAAELHVKWASIDQMQEKIDEADVIVVSTNAAAPVIRPVHLAGKGRKVVVDLSIPCNVDPEVGKLEDVMLVNVDELSKIKDETLQMRQNEIPKALAIIAEHMEEFRGWIDMRRHVPLLKEVKSKLLQMGDHASLFNSSAAERCPVSRGDASIQSVINVMASKMRRENAPGCHYIEAINDFIAIHGYNTEDRHARQPACCVASHDSAAAVAC